MWLDGLMVLAYFLALLVIGVRSRDKKGVKATEFFLSSRSLGWFSIAVSTIATNISAGHLIGNAGSAYKYGLAQAGFEINAIFGLLLAAFVFVPIYLRLRVTTITEFIEAKFGPRIALGYSFLTIVLYAFLYLGKVLFWAALAIDGIFFEALGFFGTNPALRLMGLIAFLGLFSAIYTRAGGLHAVVRTDVIQFALLLGGGLLTVFVAVHAAGGLSQLYQQAPEQMHLHLHHSHPKLPWTAIFGMLLLNLNYWGANQVILQRALAAKNLKQAQIGLLVGGFLKYFMAIIIVVPGIAMSVILSKTPLLDPDQAYIVLAQRYLPVGLRGLVLCGLFASLMSTVDSTFHSVSTLVSCDIYKRYFKPDATDQEVVSVAKRVIMGAWFTGVGTAFVFVYVKYDNPQLALTHQFNAASYYIKNGFVILIASATFLFSPKRTWVATALFLSIAITYAFAVLMPGTAYLVRAAGAILVSFAFVLIPAIAKNKKKVFATGLFTGKDPTVRNCGLALFASYVLCHIVLH